ncbi:MAG TPA: hypothetical protein VFA27_09700 [Vicinamibacterales bacterium]|nr:hypothetical protein [Vicinamibacterales bacterium]
MDLVRDLLDVQLVDREGQGLGRVDGLVLRLREGAPPRLVALDVGAAVAARRVHPRVAAVLRWFTRRVLPSVRTVRYAPALIRDVGIDVELDVVASDDPRLLRFEKWLSRHVIGKIPGGRA